MLEGDHRGVVGDPACHTQCRGVRQIGHRVQCRAFLVEHLDRTATRCAVHAGIDLGDECRTCGFDLAEAAVLAEQVRLGGHDVGLGEFDGVLHPTLGGRVGGLARQHRDTVIAAEGDRCAVADRDSGDVSGGDGLLVVGQQIGRRATEAAEDPVQSGEDTGSGAVVQRNHHPVSAPRQPRHQQHHLAPGHHRAIGEVVLQPQPGLGDPGPVHSRIAQSPL
jgi:hypothetical protein